MHHRGSHLLRATASRPYRLEADTRSEWRQYEQIFPAIAKSSIQQVAIECRNSEGAAGLWPLLPGKVVQAGVIDVASDTVETAETW